MDRKIRTFQLNKLVRDGIVDDTIAQGGKVESRLLSSATLDQALIAKASEELEELTKEITAEELADLYEVLGQIATNNGISAIEITEAQEKKRRQVGGFTNGDYIETVTLPENSEWSEYYANDPDRFPEIKE